MDALKNYIVPGLALLLLLAWFFVIQPRMTGDEASGATEAPAASEAKAPPE
jgi:hypothetical protein